MSSLFQQFHYTRLRTQAELAVYSLREVARELHEIEIRSVKTRRQGTITTGLGSSVLGTALIGGIVTANPAVTIGMFAGTVLTSLGSLIVFSKKEEKRVRELEEKVAATLNRLEVEQIILMYQILISF